LPGPPTDDHSIVTAEATGAIAKTAAENEHQLLALMIMRAFYNEPGVTDQL
jgi:hypothetical protein